MDEICFDKTNQCLEAIGLSGHIQVHLDDGPSIQLFFTKKLKVCFEFDHPSKKDSNPIASSSTVCHGLTDKGLAGDSSDGEPKVKLVYPLPANSPSSMEALANQGGKKTDNSICLNPRTEKRLQQKLPENSQPEPAVVASVSLQDSRLNLNNDQMILLEETENIDETSFEPLVEEMSDDNEEPLPLQQRSTSSSCTFCHKVFSNKLELMAHNRVPECRIKCQRCGEKFQCKADLFLHQYRKYDAKFMKEQYPSLTMLKENECAKTRCPLCPERNYSQITNVITHLQTSHFSESSFLCCVCGSKHKRQSYLWHHLRQHHNSHKENPARQNTKRATNVKPHCSEEAHTFESEINEDVELDMPLPTSLPGKGKVDKVCCQFCLQRFSDKLKLFAHNRVPECKRQCECCKNSYRCEAELFVHQYWSYGAEFLKIHYPSLQVMSESECAKTRCPLCPEKFFTDKSSVTPHLQASHFSDPSYLCCVCGSKHTRMQLLKAHFKNHHTPKESNLCTEQIVDAQTGLSASFKEEISRELCDSMHETENLQSGSAEIINFDKQNDTSWIEMEKTSDAEEHSEPTVSSQLLKISEVELSQPTRKAPLSSNLQCKFCLKSFKSVYLKARHFKAPHHEIRCPKCSMIFHSQAALTVHDIDDHGGTSNDESSVLHGRRKFPLSGTLRQCPLCSKQVKHQHLKDHINTAHIKENLFRCCVCKFMAPTMRGIIKHCESHIYQEDVMSDEMEMMDIDKEPDKEKTEQISCLENNTKPSSGSELIEIHFEPDSSDLFENHLKLDSSNHLQPDVSESAEGNLKLESQSSVACTLVHVDESETAQNASHISPHEEKQVRISINSPDKEIKSEDNFPSNVKEDKKTTDRSGSYECQVCNKSFETFRLKRKHYKVPHPEIKCPKCSMILYSQAELIVHDYYDHSNTNESPTKKNKLASTRKLKLPQRTLCPCPVCSKQITRQHLVDHVGLAHTKEDLFKCCVCDFKTPSSKALAKHCESHVNPDRHMKGLVRCSSCPQVFHSRYEFAKHLAKHRAECVFCKMNLGHFRLLNHHYLSEHADQLLHCRICGKWCVTKKQLLGHEKYHRHNGPSPCPICGVIVRSRMQYHIRENHPSSTINIYVDTPNSEEQSTSKDACISSTTENPPPQFLCSQCPESFVTWRRFLNHLQKHRQAKNPLSCPICNKKFKTGSMLTRHIDLHHLGSNARVFPCMVCGKQFNRSTNLKTHMRIHAEAKCFVCEQCGRGFNYKHSLQAHMMSKHQSSILNLK